MKEIPITYDKKDISIYVHEPVLTRYGRLPDYISDTINDTKTFFEIEFLEMLKEKHKNIGTFVDIGANIGNHSIYAHNFINAKEILCFEPDILNYEILKVNVGKYATCYNMGLSDKETEMELVQEFIELADKRGTYMANQGGNRLVKGEGVKVKTLDSFNITSCNIMKVDVEGMEPEVLTGAMETIRKYKPVIYVEALNVRSLMSIMKVLHPLNYVMTMYQDFSSPMACLEHGLKVT